MRERVLPHEEWSRLAGFQIEALLPHLNPENARILVVEDDAGKIIATWSMLRVVHAECIEVVPEHRGSLGVAKRLFRGLREIASGWGMASVITGSDSPFVTNLIERFGGARIPAESFVLPLEMSKKSRADRELGRAFHRQLEAQAPEGAHPDDGRHDEQVGRALRLAVEGHEPERAAEEYNAWARAFGYEPIKYLGVVDGKMRADVVTALVEVDECYRVRVIEQEQAICR